MDNQFENQVEVQPKKQKSGKGLSIIIIVLLLVCCGALGYFAYNLNENSTKYKNEIKDYKAEIQKLKTETNNNEQATNEITSIDCSKVVIGSQYIIENSGNDGSNGEPITENTSMSFGNGGKVKQVSGTAAWEDNYSISDNVITFENSGTKSYGIISQDCKIIYITDTQSGNNVKIYKKN